MQRLLTAFSIIVLPTAACAGATAWQDVAPGVMARLIADDHIVAGGTRAGLEVSLPPGYKTYWRVAGETGIPTQLDFTASRDIGTPALEWPFPDIDLSGGYRNYVYHGALVIPMRIPVSGSNPALALSVTMGICSDICIPAQAAFALPLETVGDSEQALRLDMAERNVPIAWDRPLPVIRAVRSGAGGIEIEGLDPSVVPESVIAELHDSPVLFGAPQKSPVGDVWTIRALGEWGTEDLSGRTLDLTFLTPEGPYAAAFAIATVK